MEFQEMRAKSGVGGRLCPLGSDSHRIQRKRHEQLEESSDHTEGLRNKDDDNSDHVWNSLITIIKDDERDFLSHYHASDSLR